MRKLIIMRRNIAFAARISVFIPGPADFGILFIDSMGEVAGVETESANYVYATDSRTDGDDSNLTQGTYGGIFDGIWVWVAGVRSIGLYLGRFAVRDSI